MTMEIKKYSNYQFLKKGILTMVFQFQFKKLIEVSSAFGDVKAQINQVSLLSNR